MLTNIRIVLINTSHPGNIGAAARAMKTMGLGELYLVAPSQFPHGKANEMAAGALDVLEKARVVPHLEDAVADCGLIIGTSARSRAIPWPMLTPRELAKKAKLEAGATRVAILFGREQSGLTNDELQRCHFHVQIPTYSEYCSLNLAAAVQVIAYELYGASVVDADNSITANGDDQWATAKDMEGFYEHLRQVLIKIDFLDPNVPRQLMTRLRRLFHRARPDVMEINILRGILKAITKSVNTPPRE